MLDWLILIIMALSTPCTAEDGPAPCYWDAATRGNGVGTSVLILEER